jgi:hypothetical protein
MQNLIFRALQRYTRWHERLLDVCPAVHLCDAVAEVRPALEQPKNGYRMRRRHVSGPSVGAFRQRFEPDWQFRGWKGQYDRLPVWPRIGVPREVAVLVEVFNDAAQK